jgi:hypothetical protein
VCVREDGALVQGGYQDVYQSVMQALVQTD